MENEFHVDRYVFTLEIYIIESPQGQISTLVYTSSKNWEDHQYEDVDLTPVNEWIGDLVEDREAEIREIIEPDETEDNQV